MDQIQIIFTFKVLIAGLLLFAGSILDIRTRRIHDEIWMLMMLSCMPLLGWEMWLKGASESPLSLLTLLLPTGGMMFMLFGYPEPKEVLKGKRQDLIFTALYVGVVIGSVLGFFTGDNKLFIPVIISFVFIILYFILYQVPIGGTRIIHGGADAKCLMALASIFPWYIEDIPYSFGEFYDILWDFNGFGYIFPIHLSVLFNAAVLTTLILLIVLPIMNLIRGDVALSKMFTHFKMDVDGITGKHVWVILEHTKKKKVEPTEQVEIRLKEKGSERVWVSPKIPFILSIFTGFVIQILVGNLMILFFFLF